MMNFSLWSADYPSKDTTNHQPRNMVHCMFSVFRKIEVLPAALVYNQVTTLSITLSPPNVDPGSTNPGSIGFRILHLWGQAHSGYQWVPMNRTHNLIVESKMETPRPLKQNRFSLASSAFRQVPCWMGAKTQPRGRLVSRLCPPHKQSCGKELGMNETKVLRSVPNDSHPGSHWVSVRLWGVKGGLGNHNRNPGMLPFDRGLTKKQNNGKPTHLRCLGLISNECYAAHPATENVIFDVENRCIRSGSVRNGPQGHEASLSMPCVLGKTQRFTSH